MNKQNINIEEIVKLYKQWKELGDVQMTKFYRELLTLLKPELLGLI